MDSEFWSHGSKESPEIYTSLVSSSHESDVSLVFKPSDQLELALSGFLRPEVRQRHQFDFKTDPIKVLPIVDGDANGWKHSRYRGMSGDQESDTDWLNGYRNSIKSIADARIPAAALPPSYELHVDNSLSIELAFVPTLAVKRKIGQYSIRTVMDSDDDGGVVQILRIFSAHVSIPDRKLISSSHLQDASDRLLEMLEWNDELSLRATSSNRRMYITRPSVSDKRVF